MAKMSRKNDIEPFKGLANCLEGTRLPIIDFAPREMPPFAATRKIQKIAWGPQPSSAASIADLDKFGIDRDEALR
jgi:hypothetical protein